MYYAADVELFYCCVAVEKWTVELTDQQIAFLLSGLDALERQFADYRHYGPGLEEFARAHSREMLDRIGGIRSALRRAKESA